MKLKIRSEEILQERDVEEISTYSVVLGDGVSELHALVVGLRIDPLVVEKVGKILV